MSNIRLYTSDWLFNAGLVGLINALGREKCLIKENYIEIDSDDLKNFSEKYFSYLINKYESTTTWYRIIKFESQLDEIIHNNYEIDDKQLQRLNDNITYTKDKIKSNSYKKGLKLLDIDLDTEQKKLKKISSIKNIDEIKNMCNILKDIINVLLDEKVKKIILAKNVMYDVIQNFWSGVSFLHTSKSEANMYDEYELDFVESVLNYLNSDLSKANYNCANCDREILKLSQPHSYEMTWLNSIGVDTSRKSSHLWNFNNDMIICPICRLVYSCVPAGFTCYYNKGFFINQNRSVNDLLKSNGADLKNISSFSELTDISFSNIIEGLIKQDIDNKPKEIDNIQVVKVDFNNTRSYTFNVLSKNMLEIIKSQSKNLKNIIKYNIRLDKNRYINIYEDVIDHLYNNQNLFNYINMLFRIHIDADKQITIYDYCFHALISINNELIGGINAMNKLSREKIAYIRHLGNELRKEYVKKQQENKIDGIAYRLLNSLRTKNDKQFLDTLITVYMYHGLEVPTVFVDSLTSEEKLQTIGYAYLLGFVGKEYKKNDEEESINEE